MTKYPTGYTEGVRKTLARNPDHFLEAGRKGGSAPHVIRGFQAMPSWKVSLAGTPGGKISRRGKRGRSNPRSLSERQRIRKEFESNYEHLLEIHQRANV